MATFHQQGQKVENQVNIMSTPHKTYTIVDFHKEFLTLNAACPDYRIGQMFITKFIKDSSSKEMQKLWNEWNVQEAYKTIYKVIEQYGWDCYDLPILNKEK